MKTKLLLFIVLAVFSFNSCEKDGLYEKIGDGALLKSVLIGGEVYSECIYNNANFILEEKSKFHYTKHNYNSKNQLIQSDSYWDESIASSSYYLLESAIKRTEWVSPENTERDVYSTFEYKRNGQLEKKTTFRINNDHKSFDTYTYNANGRIEKRTSYHDNKVSVIDNYFYDNTGNLIKQQRYSVSENGSTELLTTTEYQFDNNHNPYLSFRRLMIPGQNTNLNNITKETFTLHFEVDNSIEQVQITEYSYKYNSMGYPINRSDGFEYVYH